MMKEKMKFTTPCFVSVEDAEKRKELIQWLYEIGGRQFDEDEVSRDCQIVACDDKWFWLADASAVFDEFIDCGTDIELFKAMAAMNNKNDLNQWFTDGYDWVLCPDPVVTKSVIPSYATYHKATVKEIVKHFKTLDTINKSINRLE